MPDRQDFGPAALLPSLEALEARLLLSGQPMISEFLASNVTGIVDYQNAHDDWIEVCNPTNSALDLTGWKLREGKSGSSYTEWSFPAVTLGPGEFRIVFASGKDLRNPAGELHTNFSIKKSGEYLGLADPGGNVVQEFNPFPQQYDDMSYGVGQNIDEIKLVSAGATAKYMVPTSGALGTTWTTPGFSDTSWASGPTGLGFTNLTPGFSVWRYQGNIPQATLATAQSVIDTPAYQSSPAVTQTASTINYLGTGGSGRFAGDRAFPGFVMGNGISNVVVKATGIVTIPTAGDWTFGVNSDDGFRLTVGTQTIQYDGLRTSSDTYGTFHFNAPGNYDLSLLYFQSANTSEVELYATAGAYSVWTGNFRLVGDTANGGLTVRSQPFTGGSGTTSTFANLIKTDVKTLMEPAVGTSRGSIYTRIHFDVANLASLQSLTLKMKYDDGYVVYLNGLKIASRNAPASPAYDSLATASRTDSQATVFENVDVSPYLGLLTSTNNVLAIEELNVSATDGDLLVLPELSQINYLGQGEHYFVTPTPGAPNSSDYWLHVTDTKFDHTRGFYSAPFDLAITTTTLGATIRYTLDGSAPSPTHGTIYTGPIHIATTATVQAMAYLANYAPTNVDTETYLFLADVIHQSSNPPGFPAVWGAGVAANYQMDPDVVNNPQYANQIQADLRAMPTLSIVMDPNDMFGTPNGLYLNPGQLWEKPASIEWINTDGTTAFQIDAGLRMQGGAGRGDGNKKHSFRILFRSDYSGGDGQLHYDLYGDGSTQSFNDLTLRAGFNDVWPNNGSATYLSDRWTAQTGLDMGDVATHGTWVQLYINGLYWGMYNPVERPDDYFSATYLGGNQDDYDTYSVEGIKTGTPDGWNLLQTITTGSAATLEANWPVIQQKLDITEFCDYMLTNQFGGNWDWPWNNWWASYDHNPTDNGKWRFFSWDGEGNLWDPNANKVNDAGGPGDIFQRLRAIPEFRLAFADRVQKFLFDGGALTPAANIARYGALVNYMNPGIVGESARWGDGYNDFAGAYTMDSNWLPQVNWVMNQYFPVRTNIVIAQYQAANLFPKYTDVTTPSLAINGTAMHGGTIQPGDRLSMTATLGTIYYTLDGSDPKDHFNDPAYLYTGPVPLTAGKVVHARAVNANGVWSALQEATFYIDLAPAVRITELMYNPPAATAAEIAAGFPDNNQFEFIELTSIATQSMPLEGLRFSNGVDFTFPVMSIAPGQRVVVVADEAAFRFRYPNYAGVVAGTYTGNLSNSGEKIELDSPIGGIIHEFTYKDGWYDQTDGEGCSLTIVDPHQPLALWDSKDGWRPSAVSGGSPGTTDTPLSPGSVVINEVFTHSDDLTKGDEIELHNTTNAPIDVSGWLLSDNVQDSLGNLVLDKYRIAAGTVIPAQGYVYFTQVANFGVGSGDPGSRIGFGMSELGDDLYLSNSVLVNGAWVLGGYRDHVSFGHAPNGMSFGLVTTSSGSQDFTLLSALTIGSANAGPYTGPLAAGEVMYHPAAPSATEAAAGFTDAEEFEYLEIVNGSATAQDLRNFYVGGGIGFSFGWMPADAFGLESQTLERGATAAWSTAALASDNYEVFVKWNPLDANGDTRSLDGKAKYEIIHSGATNVVTLDQGNQAQFNADGWVSLGTYAFSGSGTVRLTRGSDSPDNWTIADQVKFVRVGQTVTVDTPVLDSYFTTNYVATGKNMLAPGARVVIVRNADAFALRYGMDGVALAGQYAGNMNNGGDSVKIFERGDYEAETGYIPYFREDYVNYQTTLPWPSDAAGLGASLCRIDPTRYGNDVGSWASSASINGTPGQPNVWVDRTPPTVPAGLAATVALGPSRIVLNWAASLDPQTGVDHYNIYRNGLLYGSSATPSFVDGAAQAQVTYAYQVMAVNTSGIASALGSAASLAIPGIVSYAITDTTRIEVLFTEPMLSGVVGGGVGNLANYTFTGGVLTGASLDPANPARVVFTTAVMQLDHPYALSVTGLQTASGNLMPVPQDIAFTYSVRGTGTILREAWINLPGSNVSDLTGSAAYPNSPSWRELDSTLGGPANWSDNYGTHLRGYVTPPATGTYTFYIAGDDSAALYLSTDSDPAHKALIASVAQPTGLTEWSKYATQVSAAISLVAGQRYYIEVLQKEGTGTDGVNVAWQWTAHGTTYPLEGPIPSMRLSPWTDASYDLSGPTAPSSLTATPLSSTQIRLNWLAAGDPQSGVSQYNIYRGGQYVGTTTGLTYTDGGLGQTTTYSYTVTASNGSKFEGAASNFASAQPGPSLLSASPMDDQHIQLTFGKAVSEIPAGTLANYTLTDSVGRVIAIDSAVWDDVSQKIVTLSLGEHLVDESLYTFTARNVTDTHGVTLDANTQKAIRFTTVCTNLLGWWTFDVNGGATAADFSGGGHDMTVSNATWQASGKIGGAYQFNGTTSTIQDPSAGAYLNGLTTFTFSAWIKSSATGSDAGFYTLKAPSTEDRYGGRYVATSSNSGLANVIRVAVPTSRGGQIWETQAGKQTTSWQHVAVVWTSGSNIVFYVDGVAMPYGYEGSAAGGFLYGITTLMLGKGPKDVATGWSGMMDDIRVYGRALTATDVADIVNQAPQAADDGPYTANAGTTLTVDAAHGLLIDDSDPDPANGLPGVHALTAVPLDVTSSAHGTVTLRSDGSFDYTPAAGYLGAASFTYRSYDGLEYSRTATVTLQVAANGLVPPTAVITAISPDPRKDPVTTVTITFSKYVNGLDITDLRLTLNGGPNLLSGAQTVTTTNHITWTVSGLSTVTALGGYYSLSLVAAGSGIADQSGTAMVIDANDAWSTDATAPAAGMAAVSPNPRNTSLASVVINFSEPISGLDLADLHLTRGGGAVAFAGQTLTTLDNMTWTLNNLTGITAAGGTYVLTLTAAGSGITDAVGNPLAGDASDTWVVDATAPTAAVTAVSPDPRKDPVSTLAINFSEAVSAFDLADLKLTRDGGANLLTGNESLTTANNVNWTLGGLGALTAAGGTYVLTLTASSSGIVDAVGNPLAANASDTWLVDVTVPTGTVTSVAPDPRNSSVSTMTLVFSEAVTGLELADLKLTRDNGANLLTGAQTLTTTNNITWTLSGLSGLTGTTGTYNLSLSAATSGVTDLVGNPLAADMSEMWITDSTPPTVQIVGVMPNPRSQPVSTISITFSESVTGLVLAAMKLTRDGGANLLTAGVQTVTSANGARWTLNNLSTITAAAGTYTVTITAAGSGVNDLFGNPMVQDSSMSWAVDTTPPTADIVDVSPDPRTTPVDAMTIVFTKPIVGLDLADLTLLRDGGANLLDGNQTLSTTDSLTWTLSGLAALTGPSGTYTLTLAAATSGITDLPGNPLPADASDTWTVTPDFPANVTITGPTSANEGATLQYTGSATGTVPMTYTWDVSKNGTWGYAGGSGVGLTAFSFIPIDNAAYQVKLTVVNAVGQASQTQGVTVNNVAPTPTITGAAANWPEKTAVVLGSTVTDPGTLDTFTYGWVVKKNGAQFATGAAAGITFTPDAPGSYEADLTVTDKDGGIGTRTATIAVLIAVPPTADIVDVTPDPRNSAVGSVQIVFNKPVAGLNLADLTLTRSGGPNLLGGGQTVTTADNITWTLAGLAGITGPAGTYTLTLTAAGSGIVDPFSQPLAGNAADSWVVDTTPPNVDIVDVAPDPRNSAVGSIQIVFSEAVAGFDLADLSLRRNGGANLLTGGQTLATSDNVTWTLSGLTGITAAAGAYTLTLTAAGSGVADAAGNLLAATASDAWTTDTTVPTVDIVDVSPDPRITAVSTISIVFSRAVAGLDLADLTLTRDGGANLLGGGQGISTTDNITWTLTGLSGITATGGAYVLTLTAAGSGIADAVGNLLAANATDAWTIDTTAPTADIVDVQPDPRDTEVSQVTIVFSEPVVGLDLADLSLTRNGGGNLLKGTETLTTTDNITWVLGGLSGITGATGLAFSAYNDHVKGATYNANATNYASNGTPNGLLKNIATGANTGATLVTSNSGGSFISTGGVATIPAGTDAYNYFNGYVNFASGTNSGIRVAGANQSYTFTFSGLDTGHADLYDFVGTALQAIGGSNSWIKITLNGADSFTAAHSADPNHTGVITSAYNSALGANQVAICTGANGSGALGYVAHWTNIDPGSDGTFTITCTQYRDIIPGGTANGSYGYALTGIRLQEISTGPTLGTYNLALTAAGSGIHDEVGNGLAASASDSWTIASNVAPTADVVDVSPDPRSTSINSVQIVFNEAVSGFDLADLSLKCDGGANLLTGSQTLTTTDNITWTLGNLAGLTTAIGAYNLTLTAAASGIIDTWGNALAGDASDAWAVTPQSPQNVTITGLVAGNEGDTLQYTGSATGTAPLTYMWDVSKDGTWGFAGGSGVDLTSFSFVPNDNAAYQVKLTVLNANGQAGQTQDVTVANVNPTATITGAPASSPEKTAITLGSTVSDPGSVDTFTYGWVIKKNGVQYAAGAGAGITFTPDAPGSYEADLTVTDDDGGVGTRIATIDVTDATPPTADIVDVSPDPRDSAVGSIQIVFSEPVAGLDLADLRLTRDGGANLLTGNETLTTTDNITWTLSGLAGLTGHAESNFVAYDDDTRTAGTAANATAHSAVGTASGLLVNIATGQPTTVTVTVTQANAAYYTTGSPPAVGTDAYNLFNGYVDFTAGDANSVQLVGDGSWQRHAFTGLDTGDAVTYSFAGTTIRGDANYKDRWTLVTLEGADSFTPAYTAGLGVVTHAINPAIGLNQVAIWTGENSAAAEGFVAAWTNIDPGADGTFSVLSSQYKGPTPGVGTGDCSGGAKGYAIAAVRLEADAPTTGYDGNYVLTLTAAGSGVHDLAGNALAGDASDAWTIAQPDPAVVDFTPNGGLDRPDKLTDLAMGFSQDVSSSLDLGDLSIHNDSTGASVNLTGATVTYDAATNTAHWNLAPLALTPGYYTVRLSCQGVTNSRGQPLGGSGGQDYVQTMMVALPGDANLDGMVGDADLLAVEVNFGRQSAPWSAGDFDHDGAVGYWDYLAVKANCGRQLSGAPSSPLSSEPAVAPTSTDTPADDAAQTEVPAAAPTPTEDVELVPAAQPAAVQAPAPPTGAGLGGASSWAGLRSPRDTVSVLSSAAAMPAAVRPAAVVVGGAADREPPAFATVRIVSAIPAVRPARSAALSWRSAMTDLLAGLPVEPSRPTALGTRLPDALAGARLAVPLE